MAAAFPFEVPKINWEAEDLGSEFKDFREYVELLFNGPQCDKWTAQQKASAIVSWAGATGRKAFSTFQFADAADKAKPDKVLDKFEKYVEPKTNKWLARVHLQRTVQKENQSVDEYLAVCIRQANKCKLKDNDAVDERVLEQLVVGMRDSTIQQKLLSKGDGLKLNEALDIARSMEASGHQLSQLRASDTNPTTAVHAVRNKQSNCTKCGRKHPIRTCPAWGAICKGCGKPNHFVQMCFSKGQSQGRPQAQKQSHSQRQPRGQSQIHEATAYPYATTSPYGQSYNAIYQDETGVVHYDPPDDASVIFS